MSSGTSASSPERSSVPGKARRGSCLCKSVKYEVSGEPFSMRVCHCGNCKKATGAAFMTNGFFKNHQLRILEGEDKLKMYPDYNTSSGIALNRYFCGECGSNVMMRSQMVEYQGQKNDIFVLALGTLDDEVDWVPQVELFKEQRRHFVTGLEVLKNKPNKL